MNSTNTIALDLLHNPPAAGAIYNIIGPESSLPAPSPAVSLTAFAGTQNVNATRLPLTIFKTLSLLGFQTRWF